MLWTEAKVALIKGFFFYTTYLLPYRQFKLMVRAAFSGPWRSFVAAAKEPLKVQQELLFDLVRHNQDTEFGRRHSFPRIHSIDDYRRAVPVAGYDAFEPYIQRMGRGEKNLLVSDPVVYFACTSGTTGRAKSIPVTQRYIEEFKRSQLLWYRNFALQFPGMIKGNPLTIISNKIESKTEAGIPCGSMTRPLTFREGDLADRVVIIPRDTFHLDDFNTKYYTLLRIALSNRISTIAAVNPSTIMMFAKKLSEFAPRFLRDIHDGTLERGLDLPVKLRSRIEAKLRPDPKRAAALERLIAEKGVLRPADAWPMLCGLACWKGGSADFYLEQFPAWFGDLPVLEFGFVATEGHFSVPLDASGKSGVFSVRSHFCEFIPEAERERRPGDPFPPTCTADQLEVGKRYYILVSGSHGLYRYDLNDLVEVTGRFHNTPMLTFLHKGGNMLSITGEKVGESHVVSAVTAAATSAGMPLDGFSVTLRLADPPHYLFAVECRGSVPEERLQALLAACDRELMRSNLEYEAKRRSQRLGEPVLLLLSPGSFERFRIRRVKEGAPDAHVKPPHLLRSEQDLRFWLEVVREIS